MSLYAMDCLEMSKDRRITQHTSEQLDLWINRGVSRWGDDFWLLLHAIDAYMERRRRKRRRLTGL